MTPDLKSPFLVQIISTKKIIRSKNLESKLTEFGLAYEITPGVVPSVRDFSSGLLHSKFISKLICQRNVTIGEVGCALAHRSAIGNFLNSDYTFGIVFEDDAEIIADFNLDIILKLLNSKLPTVVALGWIPGFAISKNTQVLLSEEPVELITSPTCAFAYALNRSAAKLILGSHDKVVDLTDWPIYTLNAVNFYSTNTPWVTANHDPNNSIIGERVSSNATSKSTIAILVSRFRLLSSLFTLILISKTNKLDASIKQIVNRLFIRDLIYKYGKSQADEVTCGNVVIPLSPKFQKLLNFFKLI